MQFPPSKKSAQWGNTVINKTVIEESARVSRCPREKATPSCAVLWDGLYVPMWIFRLVADLRWWLMFSGHQHLHICGAGAK